MYKKAIQMNECYCNVAWTNLSSDYDKEVVPMVEDNVAK